MDQPTPDRATEVVYQPKNNMILVNFLGDTVAHVITVKQAERLNAQLAAVLMGDNKQMA